MAAGDRFSKVHFASEQAEDFLPLENARLLEALRVQQSCHERNVEELLQRQLGLIARLLSTSVSSGNFRRSFGASRGQELRSEEELMEQPQQPLRSIYIPPMMQPGPAAADDRCGNASLSVDTGQAKQVEPGVLADSKSDAHASLRFDPKGVLGQSRSKRTSRKSQRYSDNGPAGMTLKELEETCEHGLAGLQKSSRATMREYMDDLKGGQVMPFFQKLTQHRWFEYLFTFLIIANAVEIGVQQDYAAQHLDAPDPTGYAALEIFFCACFSVELVLRFMANGMSFVMPWNTDFRWNLFDAALVLMSLLEIALKYSSGGMVFEVSTGRLLRLLRLVRIVRMVRVFRSFKDLRIMVLSILGSLRPLVYALLLLMILIYSFAVCVLQVTTEELMQLQLLYGRESKAFTDLDEVYGSLLRTCYTLFKSISGGVSWGEACNPLMKISPVLGFLFVVYVSFCIFCVLNIITGIFVEEAATMTAEDEEHMLMHELQRRRRFIQEVRRFFEEADTNNTGHLTWDEFQPCMKIVRMQKLLENLGVDIKTDGAHNVFELFDCDGNGSIDIEEFTAALMSWRGPARSIEVACLQSNQKKLRKEVEVLSEALGLYDARKSGRYVGSRASMASIAV